MQSNSDMHTISYHGSTWVLAYLSFLESPISLDPTALAPIDREALEVCVKGRHFHRKRRLTLCMLLTQSKLCSERFGAEWSFGSRKLEYPSEAKESTTFPPSFYTEFEATFMARVQDQYPLWLPEDEESKWLETLRALPLTVVLWTLAWFLLHGLVTLVFTQTFADTNSLSCKEYARWLNNVVSQFHAVFAVIAGAYFLTSSGEVERLDGRIFGKSSAYDTIASIGLGFTVYDTIYCAVKWRYYQPEVGTIILHHSIFIFAFFLVHIYPCAPSMLAFHSMQLTEVSTFFLNQHWMLEKIKANSIFFFPNGIALVLSFAYRCVVTAIANYMFYLRALSRFEELAGAALPYGLSSFNILHLVYMTVGLATMLILNLYWFRLVVLKAIRTVKDGSKEKST
ncbi:hypothetical protein CYMTET_17737 [Cymbomonas tetramitiformis]|uniref:TLC domain-containing protein n=1 Tax=Cymbomonas tetramitiformis TaxID=36881 RepID=A0AAE0L6Z5_9CHLO|nr:hypothetical protein CYMTET_17737 [Cymbomonas tetramitiformis]|eukprot:gene6964-8306_t